jgi:hypothetical protein
MLKVAAIDADINVLTVLAAGEIGPRIHVACFRSVKVHPGDTGRRVTGAPKCMF